MRLLKICLVSAFGVALAAGCSSTPTPSSSAVPTTTAPATPAPRTPSASSTGQGAVGAAPPQATDSANRCHTNELSASWGPTNGAAGTQYQYIGFTNKSSRTCTMFGFPGIEPVGTDGKWINIPAVRSDDKPKTVSLAPGSTGWAQVHWSPVPGSYTGPACSPGAASFVVTPPDETTQLTLPGPATICAEGRIHVNPVTADKPEGA
jgi:hypothetical protein